jgi:hypothetical protein
MADHGTTGGLIDCIIRPGEPHEGFISPCSNCACIGRWNGNRQYGNADHKRSFEALTIEQEDAIYAAVTEGIPEREAPVLGVGDELPWWAQVRTLPDALQIKSAKGLLYAVIPIRTAVGLHNDVFLVDPSTDKIIKIIRKPLTFRF